MKLFMIIEVVIDLLILVLLAKFLFKTPEKKNPDK